DALRSRDRRAKGGELGGLRTGDPAAWRHAPEPPGGKAVTGSSRPRLPVEISCGALQEFLDSLAVAAASSDPFAVPQNQELIALVERLRLANLRGVDDGRPVNPQKAVVGQSRFQPAQRLTHIVRNLGEVNSGQIVTRLDPIDLVRVEEENLSVHLHANAVLRRVELSDIFEQRTQLCGDARSRRFLQSLFRAIEGLVKAYVVNGLEQIIERAKLECRHCIVVE